MGITKQKFYCNSCNNITELQCDYSTVGTVNVITSDIDVIFDIDTKITCPKCGKLTDIIIDNNIHKILNALIDKNYITTSVHLNHDTPAIMFTSTQKISKRVFKKIQRHYAQIFEMNFMCVDAVKTYYYNIVLTNRYHKCHNKGVICDLVVDCIDKYFKRVSC